MSFVGLGSGERKVEEKMEACFLMNGFGWISPKRAKRVEISVGKPRCKTIKLFGISLEARCVFVDPTPFTLEN